MNTGTRVRTALGIAMALYVAFYKTDLTDFNNDTVNLIYQICMKIVTFIVIFLITWYNNDYTETAAKYTGMMRQEKAEKRAGYIGEYFFDDDEDEEEEGGEDEQDDMEAGEQQVGEQTLSD